MAESALSRAQWEEAVDAHSNRQRLPSRSFDGGVDLDPATGLERSAMGEDGNKAPSRIAPNPAFFLSSNENLRNPAKFLVDNEGDAARALAEHYTRTLHQGGEGTRKLYNEAVLTVGRMNDDTRPNGPDRNGEEKAASGWTLVGDTAAEARVARAFVDAVAKEANTGPNTPPKLLQNGTELGDESRNRILSSVKEQVPTREGPRVVAVFASAGQEEMAGKIARSQNFKDAVFIIPNNVKLEREIKENGGGDRIASNVKMPNGETMPSLKIPSDTKGIDFVLRQKEVFRVAASAASEIAIFQGDSKYQQDFIQTAAQDAAITGKLKLYVDHGRPIPREEALQKLVSEGLDAKNKRLLDAIDKVDQPLNQPLARVALDKIADNATDVTRLYNAAEKFGAHSVGSLAKMAMDRGQANDLSQQGISNATLRNLRDGAMVRDTLRGMERQQQILEFTKVTPIATSNKVSEHANVSLLYVKGNVDLLQSDKKTIALLADVPTDGKDGEKIGAKGAIPLYVEGKGAPVDPKKIPEGAVLVIPTAQAFLGPVPDLTWTENKGKMEQYETGKMVEVRETVYQQVPVLGPDKKPIFDVEIDRATGAPKQEQVFNRIEVKESDGKTSFKQEPKIGEDGIPVMQDKLIPRTTGMQVEVVRKEKEVKTRRVEYDSMVAHVGNNEKTGEPKRSYKLTFEESFQKGKESRLVLSMTNATGEEKIIDGRELPHARKAKLPDSEKKQNEAAWNKAITDLTKRAEVREHAEVVRESPELQAIKAVREAVIERGGAVVSSNLVDPTSRAHEETNKRDAMKLAIASADNTVILQDANGKNSVAAFAASEHARTQPKNKVVVVLPQKGEDPRPYLGNAVLALVPGEQLGKKMPALNQDDKLKLAQEYGAKAAAKNIRSDDLGIVGQTASINTRKVAQAEIA